MSGLEVTRENSDDDFDVPSLAFRPEMNVVPRNTRIVEILENAQIDPSDSLTDQLTTLEDQARDTGKDEA